ncbi:MAG: hypothetical protein QG638_2227 [Pseudomonadota bacterium]|nr:hypothetical protein [Pseudomonadota bacterium]
MSAGLQVLLARLDGVQANGPGRWRAVCPAHESKSRSRTLSIRVGDDDRTLLWCFAGCQVDDIVGAVGFKVSDLFPPKSSLSDVHARQPIREPYPAKDVLEALVHELDVAVIIVEAAETASRFRLPPADGSRLLLAARRLRAGRDTVVMHLAPDTELRQLRKAVTLEALADAPDVRPGVSV